MPKKQSKIIRKLKRIFLPKVIFNEYTRWIQQFDTLLNKNKKIIKRNIASFSYQPLISIVMPVYEPNSKTFKSAIKSIQKQLYPNWELLLVDDSSSAPTMQRVMFLFWDSRIKPIYLDKNVGISNATNAGIKQASGEFIGFMDHDDLITEDALYQIVKILNKTPDVDVFYSDSDCINMKNERSSPYFKPDWDPYLILGQNYICHFYVARKKLVDQVGGLRSAFDGSQDWDLVLRISEHTNKITHIPLILYHWRRFDGYESFSHTHLTKALTAGVNAVAAHLERRKIDAEVSIRQDIFFNKITFRLPPILPFISIIIPTKDNLQLLKTCVESIFAKTKLNNFEILIINNNSEKEETFAYFKKIRSDNVRIIDYPHAFNYSAINNFAAQQANGEILLLLNNDVEITSTGWLETLLSLIIQKDVGIVGAKLFYPNNTIQHVGIILGIGNTAGHIYVGDSKESTGYWGQTKLLHTKSCVTGACLMIKKSIFVQVNGLDEQCFPIAFNDVDLCIKVREAGYRILISPDVTLFHIESATRGYEDTPEKKTRFDNESAALNNKWGALLFNDPYYNPNLSLTSGRYDLAFPPRTSRAV